VFRHYSLERVRKKISTPSSSRADSREMFRTGTVGGHGEKGKKSWPQVPFLIVARRAAGKKLFGREKREHEQGREAVGDHRGTSTRGLLGFGRKTKKKNSCLRMGEIGKGPADEAWSAAEQAPATLQEKERRWSIGLSGDSRIKYRKRPVVQNSTKQNSTN